MAGAVLLACSFTVIYLFKMNTWRSKEEKERLVLMAAGERRAFVQKRADATKCSDQCNCFQGTRLRLDQ